MNRILEVKNLTKKYNGIKIIDNFSYTFKEGIYKVIGKNASGKTTLLKLLAQSINRDSGEIINNNMIIRNNLGDLNYKEEKGLEYIKYIVNISGKIKESVIIEKAKEFQLDELLYKNIRTYSMGERKKILLLVTFLEEPDVYLLDEPFNYLDKESKKVLIKWLKEEEKNGKIIIFSSHAKEENINVPLANEININ